MFDVIYYIFMAFVAFFVGMFIVAAFDDVKTALGKIEFSKDKGSLKYIRVAISALWSVQILTTIGLSLVGILFFYGLFIVDWDSDSGSSSCGWLSPTEYALTNC